MPWEWLQQWRDFDPPENSDLHKGPVTTAWNLLHRSAQLKPLSSIFPVIKSNGLVWLRAETLPIPNVVLKFWAWVSPVPSGEYNYCQQAPTKQCPAQGSRPWVSPMGTRAGDTRVLRWPGIVSVSPWLTVVAVLQYWLHQTMGRWCGSTRLQENGIKAQG